MAVDPVDVRSKRVVENLCEIGAFGKLPSDHPVRVASVLFRAERVGIIHLADANPRLNRVDRCTIFL